MIATDRFAPDDITAAGSKAVASFDLSQRPSLVIPIGTTSYLVLSIELMMDSADLSDTSCSPERPPKITPILSFFRNSFAPIDLNFHFPASDARPATKIVTQIVMKLWLPFCRFGFDG